MTHIHFSYDAGTQRSCESYWTGYLLAVLLPDLLQFYLESVNSKGVTQKCQDNERALMVTRT